MTNVYDQANALESALRQSEEFQQMQELYSKVNENEESKKLFDEFRELQMTLQQKQMQGEELLEEDIQKAQSSAQEIENDENIKGLMEAEQKMSQLIQDLNRVIMKPIEELYEINNQ
ncbi:YlbF family regulator [Jeotgalicoccus huakuii]|uniref:YlbF family regulator n=1 Tax=Jeotgalicoccus TaxID=227979 RepID=UPI00040C896D|nr:MULTISPECIES: YlbF family regulator [Jeotgalicoccus]MCK1976005.1 YlbF family regulator [Jeotgalicoccus huakuii]QQD85123.1 YlbF family regulator [Jeotgalicoccus sp. ATCC 8456]